MDENMQGINFNTPKKLAMPLDASFARHEKELLKRAMMDGSDVIIEESFEPVIDGNNKYS